MENKLINIISNLEQNAYSPSEIDFEKENEFNSLVNEYIRIVSDISNEINGKMLSDITKRRIENIDELYEKYIYVANEIKNY